MFKGEPQLLVRPEARCALLNGLCRERALEILAGGGQLPGVDIPHEHFHPNNYVLCPCPLCDPQKAAGILEIDVCLSCGSKMCDDLTDFCPNCLYDGAEHGFCGNCLYVLNGDGECLRPRYAFVENV